MPFFGTEFDTFELIAGWTYDSRNRALFATRGTRQQLFLSFAMPGSDVEFYHGALQFHEVLSDLENKWSAVNRRIGYWRGAG